ncbi:MAG: 16S rRNA (cytosine(967)-C(5))-methyltransferase RsmB [Ignavibacteria bacterium]|nr:16S rRNA (cytosine(967)-C(5))-methyltransferase RsmB [Ignavibacteria bacterium]
MPDNSEINEGYKELNLYEGVRGIAIKILNRIDRTDAYLDKLLEVELRNNDLSAKDKALLYEIVHGVTRWMGRIDWILTGFYKGTFSKGIPNIKNALRVALYQIMFLDKVPDYAAVNESVNFIKRLQGQKPADLTNAILRNIIKNKENIRYPEREQDLPGFLSAYQSHPSWLVKRWLSQFGEEFTEQLLIANNEKPQMFLRVNKLKTSAEELKGLLKSVNLKYYDANYLNEFIKLASITNITDWEYFSKGYFSIQDESTGFPCLLLDAKPEHKVLDLCAAPGGKTTLIAEMMKNNGKLVAIDKFAARIKILNGNLERMGVKNAEVVESDALEFEGGPFDRILIDAPCSGLGTLTKKPDIKWKRDLGDIRKLRFSQMSLLKKGASLLKSGGFLVYSTCTIEKEENFGIIKDFLSENKDFKLVSAKGFFDDSIINEDGCIQTYPHIHKMDGAFAAKLTKL